MISVPITLEQLISAIQNLQAEDRQKVAKALVQSELAADLTALIQSLYSEPAADDISDEEIMAEIRVVRQQAL